MKFSPAVYSLLSKPPEVGVNGTEKLSNFSHFQSQNRNFQIDLEVTGSPGGCSHG